MKKVLSILLAVIMVMCGIVSIAGAEEYVEEVFTEESNASEDGMQEAFDEISFDEVTPYEDAESDEDRDEVYYEETTTVTEEAAFAEGNDSVEEDLTFSEELVVSQEEGAVEVTEESISETLAEAELDAAFPAELISDVDGVAEVVGEQSSFTDFSSDTAAQVQQTFTIKNEIEGSPLTIQTFSFLLRSLSDNKFARVMIEANTTKTKDLKLPTFTKAGTYEFLITEESGTASGFSYNTEHKTYILKYVVEDDSTGKLNVITYVDGEKVMDEKPVLTFKNQYDAAKVQKTFTINNEIKGTPSTAQTFSFLLRRLSDNKIARVMIEANTTKTKDLKLPTFTKAGTYEFLITEESGTASGFSYNTEHKTYSLKYVVEDDGTGKLNVITYVDGEKVMDEKPVLTFRNKYAVKVKIQHVDSYTSKGVSGGKSNIVNARGEEIKKTWKSDGTPKEVTVAADGTYTIKEVKSPTGYQLADDVKFTVKDGEVSTGTDIKIPHTMITGSFSFKKVSSANKNTAISNAEFYLYRIAYDRGTKNYESAATNLKKGKIKWSQMKAYKRSISQAYGTVTFTTLEPDTYYVIKENSITGQPYQLTPESKSAVISTKYSSESKTVTVKVVSGNNVLVSSSGSMIWKDTPTKVTVYMRSSSGALLKGAKLVVINSAGTTIDSWVSGDSGHTIVEKLNLGEAYKVMQINQLQGYESAPSVIFTVRQENGNGQKITLTARKTGGTIIEIQSIKASGNKITLTWRKTTDNVTGYEISYSTSKDFSSGVKTIEIEDRNSTSVTIKNLKNKTRYYVRIRMYTKTSGSDYDYYTYGPWSGVKNVTTE